MKIYKEDYAVWKLNPVTKEFLNAVKQMREEGLEELSMGVHSNDIAKTYLVIGKINALTNILNMSFEETREELNDGRENRTEEVFGDY